MSITIHELAQRMREAIDNGEECERLLFETDDPEEMRFLHLQTKVAAIYRNFISSLRR